MTMDIGAFTPWSTACASARRSTTSSRSSAARASPTTTTASAASRTTCPRAGATRCSSSSTTSTGPGRVRPPHLLQRDLRQAARGRRRSSRARGDRLRPRRPEPPRLGRRLGPAPRHAVRRLPALQVRDPGREGLLRHVRRLLRPVLRALPGDGGVVEDRAPGARVAAGRRDHREGAAQHQAGGGRGDRRASSPRAARWATTSSRTATNKAYRVRARTGSFTAMGIIEDISRGLMVADLVALIASLDVVAPEIDR